MPTPTTLTVALENRSYDIVIGEHLLVDTDHYLQQLLGKKKPVCFIITDSTVASLHAKSLQDALSRGGYTHHLITVKAGESSKCFATVESVLDQIFTHQPERSSLLIALGGGVVGDLTGFIASILLRGVPFIQIPTTLLSQVDSSVGGKTGINNRFGKNLVGTFYQPRLVLADLSLLETLPERELLAGYAEVAKYGLINQPAFFTWLEENVAPLKRRDQAMLTRCVYTSCEAKAAIVAEDEREGGKRALLNLGHTFGHALEAETGYSGLLLHGESVSIGMVLAFKLSVKLGLCKEQEAQRVEQHLASAGLPTRITDIAKPLQAERLVAHMYQDKKVQDGKLVFILAHGIGQSFIAKDIDANDVLALLKDEISSNAHI